MSEKRWRSRAVCSWLLQYIALLRLTSHDDIWQHMATYNALSRHVVICIHFCYHWLQCVVNSDGTLLLQDVCKCFTNIKLICMASHFSILWCGCPLGQGNATCYDTKRWWHYSETMTRGHARQYMTISNNIWRVWQSLLIKFNVWWHFGPYMAMSGGAWQSVTMSSI